VQGPAGAIASGGGPGPTLFTWCAVRLSPVSQSPWSEVAVTRHAYKTYTLCGVPITAVTTQQAAEQIVRWAQDRQPATVHLCNTYTLSLLGNDSRLKEALLLSSMNLPDGAPVAYFGKKLGLRGPVRGPSLLREVAYAGLDVDCRHYFYGGAPGVAEQLAEALQGFAPGLSVAGVESPAFGVPTDSALAASGERMRRAGANVVWVGLGTPRQDYVVAALADASQAVVVPVGAAFDFLTGRIAEAPSFLHGSGFEWLHRLTREPRRLWRRYLFGGVRFLALAISERHKHASAGS
jgi:N-acetylglucosaminyldiphosphoundecaprenol N-acetyl-beta-D-mannosaminyltransferase